MTKKQLIDALGSYSDDQEIIMVCEHEGMAILEGLHSICENGAAVQLNGDSFFDEGDERFEDVESSLKLKNLLEHYTR